MLWARGSGHDRYLSVAVCLSVERGRPGSGFHPRACSAAHVARIDPRPAIVAALLAYTFFFSFTRYGTQSNACNCREDGLAL